MNSNKINSNDKEKDFLEEEFLKCNLDDIPLLNPEIENCKYEEYVEEVMKSGCNRQIAEYAILKYINIEKEEIKNNDNYQKLSDYRDKYNKIKNPIIDGVVDDIINYIENKEIVKIGKSELRGYEEEIEEILEKENIKNLMNNDKNKFENFPDIIAYYLNERLSKILPEKKKEFGKLRENYIDKRDAVIEAALRKVKKIVNDENEYKIFYKEYYGKE